MTATYLEPDQPILRQVRWLTLFISTLAFVVGPLLFLLPGQTNTLFAWTINPPLTAAFLGACYLTALVIEWIGASERSWGRVRVMYPAMLVFTTLTLIATLLHLDKFHFQSVEPLARLTAYAWTVIYILTPLVMLVLFAAQIRRSGGVLGHLHPLPTWFRLVLGFQTAVMLVIGLPLFLFPQTAKNLWPWMLTPLTSQAVGSWMLGLGFAAALSVWENDWQRVEITMVGNIVTGTLQLIALARFSTTIHWDTPGSYLYLIFLIGMVLIGAYGLRAARQTRLTLHSRPVV